jgi:hypothetical protein
VGNSSSNNAVLRALQDTDCVFGNTTSCLKRNNVTRDSSFKMAAVAVLTGLVGALYLFVMIPCGVCRCMRCCAGEQSKNLSTRHYLRIYLLTAISLIGFFVTVGYMATYKSSLTKGIEYGMCAATESAQEVIYGANATTYAMEGLVNATSSAIPILTAGALSLLLTIDNVTYANFTASDLLNVSDAYVTMLAGYVDLVDDIGTNYSDVLVAALPTGHLYPAGAFYNDSTFTFMFDGLGVIYKWQADITNTTFATMDALGDITPFVMSAASMNGAVASFLDHTLLQYGDSIQTAELWMKRGFLGLAILILLPILMLFASVCVIAPGSYAATFSDPRLRPATSYGAFNTWCWTMLYAVVVLAVSACVFVSG